jgi:hypothetical protein
MKIRRVTQPDGTELQVRDEEFEIVREEWSEYRLKDGGKVRLRATALMISRVLDSEGKPTYTPDGQPALIVNNTIQIVASE